MRLILGIFFGFLLTVAGAYWHDAGTRESGNQLVNWDVADRTFRDARETAERGWDRLTGQRETARDERERL